jgi:hypothetical protein
MIAMPSISFEQTASVHAQRASAVVQSRYASTAEGAVLPTTVQPPLPDDAESRRIIAELARRQRPSAWHVLAQVEPVIFGVAAVLALIQTLLPLRSQGGQRVPSRGRGNSLESRAGKGTGLAPPL